jgi:hypothetical protein
MRYYQRWSRTHEFKIRVSCRSARQGGGAFVLLGQGLCRHKDDSPRENKMSADKSIRDVVCRGQRIRKIVPVGGTLTLMELAHGYRLRVGICFLREKRIINLLRTYVSAPMKHFSSLAAMMLSFTYGEYWIW